MIFTSNYLSILLVGLFFITACQQPPPPEPPVEPEAPEAMDNSAQMDAIVQNFLNAWNSQDASNIGSFMVSDFERWNNGKKIVSSLDEMQNFMNGNFAMSSDAKVTLSEQDHVGNKIYVKWNYSGTNSGELADGSPATNKSFSNDGISVVTVNDEGKAVKEEVFFDSWNMNEQLGYSMNPPTME